MSNHPETALPSNLSPAEAEAYRYVYRLRHFYHHVAVFVVVIGFLALINLVTRPDNLWFQWPLLGWGLWLILHALRTFAKDRYLGHEWEETQLKKRLADKP